MTKMLAIVAFAVLFANTPAGHAMENGLSQNRVSLHNGISRNGITRNGITRNGITRNGITRNGIDLNAAPAAEMVGAAILVDVELPR